MGMSLGGGKGPSATINVTPMIDVLLVLLIIFMIITPFSSGEKALIPQPSIDKTPPKDIVQTVVLQVIASGDEHPSLKINDDKVSWDDLKGRLKAIYDLRNEKVIFLKADPSLDWEQVAQVIDATHTAGVVNVGLITNALK